VPIYNRGLGTSMPGQWTIKHSPRLCGQQMMNIYYTVNILYFCDFANICVPKLPTGCQQ
jgi:hypothetical protein